MVFLLLLIMKWVHVLYLLYVWAYGGLYVAALAQTPHMAWSI